MEQKEFISKIKDKAIELQTTYNILSSITIAQAILESGWGTSELFQNANSSFGIKWSEGCGYDKYLIKTKEVQNGQKITTQTYFRKYISLEDSIKDHAVFLQKERYKNLLGDTNYKTVANNLYVDGYSTSSEYPSKLIKLIEQYNLNQYDSLSITTTTTAQTGYVITTYLPNGSNGNNEFNGVDANYILQYFKDIKCYFRGNEKGVWIETQILAMDKCLELKNTLGSWFYKIS